MSMNHFKPTTWIALVLAVWLTAASVSADVLLPTYDLWLRESSPDTSFENDALWSAHPDAVGENRWSVAQWDLSGLPEITTASMDFNPRTRADAGSVQIAFSIAPGIDGLTWNGYQADKAATEAAFEGLGGITVPAGGLPFGSYAAGNDASIADLAMLNAIRTSADPRVAVMFRATSGAMEWNDGANAGGGGFAGDLPIKLLVNDTPPPPPPPPPANETTLEAVGDTWIREVGGGTVFENDWVSVWSAASNDGGAGGRRYGLIEWDVSELAGVELTEAHLSLWSGNDFSGTDVPIKMTAFVINTEGGTPLLATTWDTFQSEYNAGKSELESLGRYDAAAPNSDPENLLGVYVDDNGASPLDLAAIMDAANSSSGLLSVVFIADEDGTDYRADWGDGANAGGGGFRDVTPGLLVVTQVPEPSTLVLIALGLIGMIGMRFRSARRS